MLLFDKCTLIQKAMLYIIYELWVSVKIDHDQLSRVFSTQSVMLSGEHQKRYKDAGQKIKNLENKSRNESKK